MAGDIQTTSGTKFYISTTAAASTVDDVAGYEALTFTEVKEVEDIGNLGDVSSEVTGAAIGDSRIRKAKCAQCRDDESSASIGAARCRANGIDRRRKNLRQLCVQDQPPPATGTAEIQYFRGLVMSNELRLGTNDNIRRRAYNIGVNSAVTIDPATPGVLMARSEGGSTTATPQETKRAPAAAAA
jgi:hypothetical protein